jgi:uncharacterized membrane protein YkvA (DUF1232 family)
MDNIHNSNKFKKILAKAEKVVEDNGRVSNILSKSFKKLTGLSDHFVELKNKILMCVYLVKDWAKGDYREVPKKTIIYIVCALIYFVMPLDLIPDFLFKFGFIDDLAVLNYVFSSFAKDISKYEKFREEKEKKTETKEKND